MGMGYRIDVTSKGIDAMEAFLNPALFKRTINGALRYAGSGARATAAKEIKAAYNLPSSRVKKSPGGRDQIRLGFPSDNALQITFAREAPALRAYGGRMLSGNIYQTKIFRSGSQSRIERAFILNKSGGLPAVYSRTDRKVRVLYGPSVGSIFVGKSKHGDQIRKPTVERVNEQFLKGVQRELARRARGR
jgi:hypothetical protein